MAQIDLGKLKFQWKGNYADSTAYEIDDVVFDASTAWVCTAAVAASNTTNPEANASFARMASGMNWRGDFSSSNSYYLNDIVKSSTTLYRYKHTTATNNAPPNATFWDVFLQTGDTNVITTSGDLSSATENNVIQRYPISTTPDAQLSVKETPLESFPSPQKAVYSVNTTGTNTAILTNEAGANVGGGGNSANAAITLTRGKEYYFEVPTGATYSFKNTADGSYSTSGTGGRLTTGLDKYSITGGGMFRFVPTQDHPNSTVVLRNEAGGADVVTFTLVDPRYGIQWSTEAVKHGRRMPKLYNQMYNTWTESVSKDAKIPAAVRKWGRGTSTGQQAGSYRTGGFIDSSGICSFWGYTDNTTPAHGIGHAHNSSTATHLTKQFRWPLYWKRAQAGDSTEAKWLTDIDGQNMNLEPGENPKIIHLTTAYYGSYALTENGILFTSGTNGYGAQGDGTTTPSTIYAYVPCAFYDDSATPVLLSGANRPKIRYFHDTRAINAANQTYGTYYAIDTDGYLYCWGHNAYKQVGDGTTTNLHKALRIPKSKFNNEKVVWAGGSDVQYTASYAITETGKLYAWGQNDNGQCGNGTTTDVADPFEITGRANANSQVNPLLNKKVVHLMFQDGNQNVGGVHILTDEGKVYFGGYSQGHGQYSGVYNTTSTKSYGSTASGADTDYFKELTDAATTINSDNQKVVSMWTSNGRYCTNFYITDGGDSNKPKVYSQGGNSQGQMCAYRSITYGGGASTQGTTTDGTGTSWFLTECQFRTFGDHELGQAGNVRPGEVIGKQYSFSDSSHANYQEMKIGRIVKVAAHQITTNTSCPVVALDEYGQLWIGGHWPSYVINTYNEEDDIFDFEAAEAYTRTFTPCWNQPEPMEDFGLENNSDEDSWIAIGKSGRVYFGGYSSSNASGLGDNTTWHGLHALRNIGY